MCKDEKFMRIDEVKISRRQQEDGKSNKFLLNDVDSVKRTTVE